MRQVFTGLIIACGWLVATGSAQAQRELINIKDVRVGFFNPIEDFYKPGTWTPVVVLVDKIVIEPFEGTLVVETTDTDGVGTRFTPRTIFLNRDDRKAGLLTYIKTGSLSNKIRVTLEGKIGQSTLRPLTFNYPDDLPQARRGDALLQQQKLVLALGNVTGLQPKDLPDIPEATDTAEGQAPAPTGGLSPAQSYALAGEKPWRVATQTDVNLLPEHWFGYDSVDTVILGTGGQWDGSVAKTLASDETRRVALAQWVEMGGHLIIAVGANRSFVGNRQSFPLEPILPAEIDPNRPIPKESLSGIKALVERKVSRDRRSHAEVKQLEGELTRLNLRGSAHSLTFEQGGKAPSIVQAPYGLGRITLIGFDIDRDPFAGWANAKDFWTALLDFRMITNEQAANRYNAWDRQYVDLATDLVSTLEQFGDVQVIPFGWVALFIFIYILIVGPIDYLFLKKVVKRLEWTWVTFPTVVLVVSLGAYFLAYYLKGDELRINKVDVVDIDLHPQTQQVYGSSWFTVFSPRLQHYDIGVEPSGLGSPTQTVNVSWMGRPDYGARSLGRGQGPSLFQRTYDYEKQGESLKGVPIQVWSMKTLTGRWMAALPQQRSGQAVVLDHDLKAERGLLHGSLQSQLPARLVKCRLIYRDYVWELGTLEPGQKMELKEDAVALKNLLDQPWGYASAINQSRGAARSDERQYYMARQSSGRNLHDTLLRMMLFRKTGAKAEEHSDYVDYLDQSWRLEFDKEAMILGIMEDADGSSTTINQSNRIGCRLNPFAPDLRGAMKESTIVRIFFPVPLSEN